MKAQSWLFTFIGASVAAYLGTVAYIHHFDKQEMQRRLQESQTSNAQQYAVETVFIIMVVNIAIVVMPICHFISTYLSQRS